MVNESCRDLSSSSSDGNAVAMRTDESQRWRGHSTDFVVCLHQLLDLGGGEPRLLHGVTLVLNAARRRLFAVKRDNHRTLVSVGVNS